MKKLLWIILIVIGFFWILGKYSEESNTAINDRRTYETNWREPTNKELLTISKLMIKNNIKGCGEYHVKEIENGEYLIACTRDGKNWTYYIAWPNIDKIYLTSLEMEQKLKPPY
ncbi:hypothetical protein [Flavobacterium sp. AJR]|jgi:hypothetical protein|uniref:hypothetical protein n=1 Tax=Flavobacterium sp. AJR TaxID=1979369 RepID=UPI000A3D8509|nr:hypothetical protein [Flavobacterium sp. AJR]OUL63696.1 hypothetical protein B8T70_03650 [Flavobacterium sp. AJR]